jgi:hypothetical protein
VRVQLITNKERTPSMPTTPIRPTSATRPTKPPNPYNTIHFMATPGTGQSLNAHDKSEEDEEEHSFTGFIQTVFRPS